MDNKEEERLQEQEDQSQQNAVDKINNLISKSRSAYSRARGARGAYKTAGLARRASTAARMVSTAVSTSEIWVPILVILFIILFFVILIIVVFGGGSGSIGCSGISSNSGTANASSPVTITVDGCPGNVTYSWQTPPIGTLSPTSGSPSVLYTPPPVTSTVLVSIVVNVCSSTDSSACSQYSIDISVTIADCRSSGGTCTTSNICTANGIGTIPGVSGCTSGDVCCKFTPSLRFYCQYDSDWSTGTCNIATYGCAPTSLAMIMATFKSGYTPLSVALANGRVGGCYDGTNASELQNRFFPWMRNQGFTVVSTNLANGSYFNVNAAKSYLANGYYLFIGASIYFNRSRSCYPTPCLKLGGHAFVISSIDGNNYATVSDPTFCTSDTNFTRRSIRVSPLTYPVTSWYWAYPIKL